MNLLFAAPPCAALDEGWYIPLGAMSRTHWEAVAVTAIGGFGAIRKPRPGIPAHLHAGIDIRPASGEDRSVYPSAAGEVISIRRDGPFAQIIVLHAQDPAAPVWTVYEHVSGIRVRLGDAVFPETPIARLMNAAELNRFGWQFDHLHFEILRRPPKPIPPTRKLPERFMETRALVCRTRAALDAAYYDPVIFLSDRWDLRAPAAAADQRPSERTVTVR